MLDQIAFGVSFKMIISVTPYLLSDAVLKFVKRVAVSIKGAPKENLKLC